MRYAQKNDIKQLIDTPENSRAISIFLPTHRISLPHNLRADRVRMKNAIRDIVANLEDEGVSPQQLKEYVEPLHKLHADFDFWKYRDNGLAIYARRGKAIYYDLPIEIEPSVHVGQNFIISPLLAGNSDTYNYFVLELNLEEPRAFMASQASIERILEDELPGTLETALRIDEYQASLQHGTSNGGSRDAHHHGHGGESDHKMSDIRKYYRLIEGTMQKKLLKNSNLPLILAGDRHMNDEFRKLSSYPHIIEKSLEGNHQRTEKHNIHMESWALMCEHIEKQEGLFMRLFEKAKHRDGMQALVNGQHIRKAARQGRIATLSISIVHRTYDSVIRRMEKRFKIALPSSKRQLKNIEQTARAVLEGGGDIRALLYSNDAMNNDQYIKAISR